MNAPSIPTWVRRTINVLGVVLLVAIVVPFVAFAIPQAIGASGSYIVQSGSMEPAIQTGSVIFVYETAPADVEAGDIITYDLRDPDREVTTHRVVDVIRDEGVQFQTKGDNNEEDDPYRVPGDAVIGTVPTTPWGYAVQIPFLGRLLVMLSSRWAILGLAIVPAALLIVSEAYDLVVAYRAAASETEEPVTDGGDDRS